MWAFGVVGSMAGNVTKVIIVNDSGRGPGQFPHRIISP